MTKHKTHEEMAILIAKLNKREIKWDDIGKELEIMRKRSSKQSTKNNT